MKTTPAFLVLNEIETQEKNSRNIEGVFFSKRNAKLFARQLMEEYKPYKKEVFFSIKKILHYTGKYIPWK